MNQDVAANRGPRIQTTLGDLIEAVTHIALKAGKTQEEGYQLASIAINDILRKNHFRRKVVLH